MSDVNEKLIGWLLGGKTGVSSETIAAKMTGQTPRYGGGHPHDGGDFERCEGLLDAVPEFRDRLPEMAEVSPYWAALIARWDEIRALPIEERYDLMRSILDPSSAKTAASSGSAPT